MKAIRKEPADRYATAQEMADDLQRFLDRRPILARRPTRPSGSGPGRGGTLRSSGSGSAALILLSAASLVSTAARPPRAGEDAGRAAKGGSGVSSRASASGRSRGAIPPRPTCGRRADPGQRGGTRSPSGNGGPPQAAPRLGAGILPRVHRRTRRATRMRRPSCATRRGGSRRSSPTWRCSARRVSFTCSPSQPAHDDLRLDEGQRAKVAELSARAGKRWTKPSATPPISPPVERVRMALEQARANEAEVDAILTPPQRVRLRQIALQSEGPAAFREPEVVEALGLTPGSASRSARSRRRLFFGQIREMQSGKPPKTLASRRWNASWPSSPPIRPGAGRRWPASRSAAR